MANISRDEFEARFNERFSAMDKNVDQLRDSTRDDFKSVWKAIDMMLIKTGAVVTIVTSMVMAVFKFIESGS